MLKYTISLGCNPTAHKLLVNQQQNNCHKWDFSKLDVTSDVTKILKMKTSNVTSNVLKSNYDDCFAVGSLVVYVRLGYIPC